MAVSTEQLAGTFVADRLHSSIVFAVRHMKVSLFRASFADFDARLSVDDGDLRLDGSARVESVSIETPTEFREHVVYGADFFDGRRYPDLAFRSKRIDVDDGGGVTIDGELTIKGVSRAVSVTGSYHPPVDDPFGGQRAALELSARIDRRDWGLDWQMPLPDGGDALGWDVEMTVHLELVKEV